MTFEVYQAKEWQCRYVFDSGQCCIMGLGHDGEHRAAVVGTKNARFKDIDNLIKHVGCGTVDEMGCCVFCDQIRARLRSLARTADAVDPQDGTSNA